VRNLKTYCPNRKIWPGKKDRRSKEETCLAEQAGTNELSGTAKCPNNDKNHDLFLLPVLTLSSFHPFVAFKIIRFSSIEIMIELN